jgi:lipopolysaccharide transport system permease protein
MRPPAFSVDLLWRSAFRLWQYRDLLHTLSVHRLRVRYKQSVLGYLWAIVQPVSLMLIYTLIFSRLARVDTGGVPYPLFAFTALLPWTAFATAVSTATGSLVGHAGLVTKVYFPREILPLTYIIAALVDLLTGGVVVAALMVYYGVPLTWHVLYAIPTLAILAVFAVSMSLFLCAVQVRYRDIGIAMPLVLQLWMFATPVVYPLSMVPPAWQSLYVLNPMVGAVEGFRGALLEGAAPDPWLLFVAATVSLGMLPVALLYFKHVEATVADLL